MDQTGGFGSTTGHTQELVFRQNIFPHSKDVTPPGSCFAHTAYFMVTLEYLLLLPFLDKEDIALALTLSAKWCQREACQYEEPSLRFFCLSPYLVKTLRESVHLFTEKLIQEQIDLRQY
jgi:hypothetical protein